MLLIFTMLTLGYHNLSAQLDPQFSSNMFNHVAINPGKAGATGQMNAFGLLRQQWVDFGDDNLTGPSVNSPNTNVFSLDANVKILNKESGLGITLIDDNLGLVNNLSINFIYSYRKKLWNGFLGVGLGAGIVNSNWKGTDYYVPSGEGVEGLEYISQLTNAVTISQLNTDYSDTKFDMNLGAFFEEERYYFGLSIAHLFRPELEVSETGVYLFLDRTIYITGGYRYQLENNPKFELSPSLFMKMNGTSLQTDINCNLWYQKSFYGGLSYRLEDGFVFLLGAKLRNGMFVGYAFDLTTSRMRLGTYGSHEVFLGYSFDLNANKQKSKHKSIRIL